MVLSSDLTSQFAKLVTTDKSNKNSKQESIVYGTVVEYNGSKYVRIDGSGAMTPVVTTADTVVGERVTVMIKNHLATITGNISSPSARVGDVSNLGSTVDTLNGLVNSMDIARFEKLEAVDAEIMGTLKAQSADITDLKNKKLDTETANITYANIDFSNIGKSAMEYFYANSGLIDDVIIGDTTITGKLVGVTISGDLIEGNTIVAEKLVVKGNDGLYYKLNTDGVKIEAEQTDYNSLNGQIIKAQSITASKIAVDDLVAFDATIGGFNITNNSIYSGAKSSVTNTTRGIYLDNDGQIALGDSTNFLRYYRTQNGAYRLEISADSVVFNSGVSAATIEDTLSTAIISNIEEFYQSDSPTTLSGGTWSETQPTWIDGKYIWRRTRVVYGDGVSKYMPSESGVCITGNTGAKGDKGEDSILLMIESSNGNIFKNTGVATTLTVNVIVGDKRITSYRQLQEHFGSEAYLQWSIKRQGETEFTNLPADDSRISDNGFILTLTPSDVNVKTVFDCSLNY